MATFVQRNVPTIEACRYDNSDEFHEWALAWDFDFEWGYDDEIRFRVKQTMAAEEWRTVQLGDWIIYGAFDFYTMDDKSFQQHYRSIE
jgi:hypothetical protein